MVIRSCKVQKDVKSNLYDNLDIIPEIGTNGSKPWSKQRSKWTPTSKKLVQNGPKWSETVQNYRKGVKIFKNLNFFSINSKKFKTLYNI